MALLTTNYKLLKGKVHPKMKILSLFSHPHVVQNFASLSMPPELMFCPNRNCLVTNILQNIFHVPQSKISHAGLQ